MSTATGYAVYDETLERFVTGVHSKAADAEAQAGDTPEGHKRTTRKV